MPTYQIKAPDGKTYEIDGPPGASQQDVINAVLFRNPEAGQPPAAPKEGIMAALTGGTKRFGSTLETGLESLINPELAAKRGAARQEEIGQQYAPGASLEKVKQAYEQKGLFPAAYEAVSQIPAALVEQAPQIASAIGGARVGATAGSMFGPTGALVGGIGGAFVPTLTQLYGANLERQAQEKAPEISRSKALGAAIPGAGLEVASTFIPLGRNLIGKLLGPEAEKALARGASEGVEAAAKESLRKSLAKGAGVGALAEVPTEVTQQMLERLQAGLPVTTPDALAEYGEAAYGAAMVGAPFGAAARGFGRPAARAQYEKQLQGEQLKAQQEKDKQAADALKQQEQQLQTTQSNLGVPVTGENVSNVLMLPAPAKEVAAEKDPLQDPVGRITEAELGKVPFPKGVGSSQVVNYIKAYRKESNLPPLKTYSLEDIKDAMTAKNPEGEVGALNAILAYKTNYQNETYTPEDIQNRAVAKNVATETKGFSDFLTRATGKSDLNTMTQPELHSVATALDALNRTGKEEQLVLPEGSNATRFTQEQYDAGITAALLETSKDKPVTYDEALKRVQTQKGIDSDQAAERLLKAAASNDDLVIEKGTGFQAVSRGGVALGTYATEAEAKRNHRRADILPVETQLVRPREEESTEKVAQLPEGYEIQKKTVAGETTPAAYAIREEGSQKNASQTFNVEIDAKRHLELLTRKREALAAAELAKVDALRKKLEKQQASIAQMEAEGNTDTAEHKNAVAAFKAAEVAAGDQITQYTEKAEALRAPLKIVPIGKKTAKVEKHTVIKGGKEIGTFTGDKGKTARTKAEEFILSQASDAELQTIADRGGVFGKRAEIELDTRAKPGIRRATTEGLEKAGVHTPEVEAQLAELKAKLLPMLKKFGLEQVGLNVIREIENNADGAWGGLNNLIRIAFNAKEPIKTMRHEALHALFDLGFFTPQQWEALKREAKKTWVDKYLKGVAFNDTMSRFDAYTAMGLSDEAILEEAIADAFGDWEGGAKPPPGMMAALFKRLQQFFAALRQALTGAGFQSADEIFGKIERGELKAGKEAAGTEEKMSLSGIGVPMSTRNLMEVQTPVAQQELGLNTEIKRGRFNNVRDIATALNQYTLDQLGAMDRQDLTQEDSTKIAKAIADEVAFQLNTLTKTGTGLGWYSTNYPNAVKRLANRFPELGTSRHARSVFSAIVAVTSNGERVAKNIDNAIKLYAKLRDGKPMVAMGNRRGTALKNNLAQIQYLLAEHGQDFEKVLLKEITVKEMNAKLSELGEDTDNSYLANTVVPAAAVYFGPKLGAFYANLSGSEGYLTMDLWWTRSINRMRGLLMPKATESSINKFRDMMDRPSATREEVVSATIPFRDKYEEYGFNTELEHLAGSKEPRTNAKKPAWFKKAEAKAGDAFEQMLFDHNIEKMANTIYKNEFEMLEEAPFTATDRKFMYDAARKAQSLLQKEGIDLTLADIQAALWYYEKRLYQKLSGRKADDIGYEEAIIAQANQGNGRARPSVVFDQQPSGGTQPRGAGAEAVGVRGQPAITSTEQGVSGDNKYSIPTGKFTLRPSGKGNKSISRGRGDTFGFVGPAGLGQAFKEHDVRTNREIGKRPNVEVKQGDGRGFTGFFSNISLGFKGKPNAKPYEPTLNVEPIADFVREYNNHRGNFDDHIATSIPGFREVQTIVGNAIAKTYKNADMLDIGASEGALIKAVTKMSNGGVRTVALDPNFAMAKHFNDGEKVEGSVYDTSAFGTKADEGQLAWNEDETLTDRDGQVTSNLFAGEEVRWFKPDRQFDVIHEAMVFQFISGNRASQIARAKELMKPDGVLIIEEKFVAGDQLSPEQFRANETQKDAYKEQYFTKAEIAAKAKAVGVAEKAAFQEIQEKKEQQVTGMNDLMVSPGAIEDVLGSNFDHVAQFWDSGNFKGYIASDSPEAVERLINNMLSTDSEFANVKTPRAVKYSLAPSDDGIVLGRLQPDAVEFPGVHYGNVQTDELQGSKYGTGLRGAERRRLQNTDDERIKNRVYFYINKPDGTMPIPESGVGNHVYTQKFKNILGPGKKMTEISKEAGADFNYFEAGIVDAGYDGYAVPEMGMMVILNHNVPVNYRGTRAELPEGKVKLSLRKSGVPVTKENVLAAMTQAQEIQPYMNCQLCVQMATGVSKLLNLPKVKEAKPGDVYTFGERKNMASHYAVDLGDGNVAEVEEWGADVREVPLSDVVSEYGEPDSIRRPPDTAYTGEKYSLRTYFPTAEEAENAAYKAAPPATPEFKRFFGASKAKEEGRPQVMYHASPNEFDTFRENKPIFVSSDAQWVEDYVIDRGFDAKKVKIYPLWVRAETPFDYENPVHVQNFVPELYQRLNQARLDRYGAKLETTEKELFDQITKGNWGWIETPAAQAILKERGYDSFFVHENKSKNLAVFSASQVKSATGNIGEFGENKDIRYSLRSFNKEDLPQKERDYILPQDTLLYHGAYKERADRIDEMGGVLLSRPPMRVSGGTPNEGGLIFFGGEETARRYANSEADPMAVQSAREFGIERLPGKVFETATDRPYKLINRYYKINKKEANLLTKALGLPDYKALSAGDPLEIAAGRASDYSSSNIDRYEVTKRTGTAKETIAAPWPKIFEALGVDGFFDGFAVALTANNGIRLIGKDGKLEKYSLPKVSAAAQTRRDETTQQREHKGFIDRILGVFAPESLADLRASFIHRYNQLGVYDRMLAEKMGGHVLLADMSAEAAANMSDLSASVTYAAFGIGNRQGGIPVYKNGVTTVDTSTKGPLQILSPLAQFNDPTAYQDYQFWAGVKRGSRFMAEKSATGVVSYREKNFQPTDIALAEEYRKAYLAKGVDFNVIQKEMNTFNDGLVDYMKATGVLAPERAAEFKKHMDYIPFYRQLDGENTVGPKIFNSISGVKPPKKLKGSEAPLTDYLESIVQNTQAAINAGMKNMAAQRAVNVAMQLGKIAGAEKIDGVSSAPDSVTFLENGKAVSYRVADQLFINAVKSLNMAEIPFLGMFSAPSNLLRNLVTKDPGFMLANLARDSLSAWVTSGSNMTPIIGTAANFAKALSGKDPTLQALYNAGILGGYEFSSGVMKSAETLEKDLNKKYGSSGKAAPLKVFNGIWDALEKGTEASDAATRMAVYERVLAETGNETEALYRALEVMNFNRKGSSPVVRILTAAIPFLNARVQGLDVFYRTAFGRNVSANAEAMQKAFFVRGATLMALSCAYFLAVSDDDEWKKQEQETKDNYWIAPGIGKFPTPFEVGFLFKTVPERIMAYTLKDDTGQDLMASMQRGLLNTFAFNPIPQIAKPIIEYNANYNFFTGRPIVGQGMEGLEPQYQVGPNTTKVAEIMGKALGMPPIKLDQLINSYTGTMGMYAMTAIDSVLDTQSNSPNASKRFEQLPIVKRFAADPEARGNITQYYELKKAVDAATQTENYLLKAGKPDEFREFMEQNKGLLAIKPYVADIEKSMKETREMRKMVQGAEMSGDEKRDILTRIGQKENNLTSNIQTVKKMISELQ